MADETLPSTEIKTSAPTADTATDSLAKDLSNTNISDKETTQGISDTSNTITSDSNSSPAPNVIESAPGLSSSTHNTSPPHNTPKEPKSSAPAPAPAPSTADMSTLDGAIEDRGVDTVTQTKVMEDTLASGEISPTNTGTTKSSGTGAAPGKPLQAVSDATPSRATPEQPHKMSMKEKIKEKLHRNKH